MTTNLELDDLKMVLENCGERERKRLPLNATTYKMNRKMTYSIVNGNSVVRKLSREVPKLI